MKMAQQNII